MNKLTETNWMKYLKQASNIGFAVISASVEDTSATENAENTNKLKNLIRDTTKFAFKPVDGTYTYTDKDVNNSTGNVQISTESSFMILAYDKTTRSPVDFKELSDFAMKAGRDFNQGSVLLCEPHGKPYYYYFKDESTDTFNKVAFDDFDARYGTANKGGAMVAMDKANQLDDEGKLKSVKHSFTVYNGKRPVHRSDSDDTYTVDYTDDEKAEAAKNGVDLDKKNSFTESTSTPKNKEKLNEAVFMSSCGTMDSVFEPVEEKQPGDEYNTINDWVSKKMGFNKSNLKENTDTFKEIFESSHLKEMNIGWAIEVKMTNGTWFRPVAQTTLYNTKDEAINMAKKLFKDREVRAVKIG